MNISKRLYRGTMVFMVVFLLAPMQDGCKFEKAQAEGQKQVAPASARLPVTQANRKGRHERG